MNPYDNLERDRIAFAKAEANRFLRTVHDYEKAYKNNPEEVRPKQNAAVKRASMDLSHALTAVRASKYK